MEIIFILNEPELPENIGSSVRALKTMGFTKLRIVNPGCNLNEKAKWVAYGAEDVFQNIELYSDLQSALQDIDFVIGTTAKRRRHKVDRYPSFEIAEIIFKKRNSVNKTGILFGNEKHGLTNKDLAYCDIISSIPMKTQYPSLNLSHAVMIYAYEIFKYFRKHYKRGGKDKKNEYKVMKEKITEILRDLGISERANLHNRIMERISVLEETDIHLVLSVCEKYFKKYSLENNEER